MFDQYSHEASGMQSDNKGRKIGPAVSFQVIHLLQSHVSRLQFYEDWVSALFMRRAQRWVGMAVASVCHASGLMGKNGRNLQLIMPCLEMFVSRLSPISFPSLGLLIFSRLISSLKFAAPRALSFASTYLHLALTPSPSFLISFCCFT